MTQGRKRLALALALLTLGPVSSARADQLIGEPFSGSTVSDTTFASGGTGFTPCLTASQNTSQSPIPGCAKGAGSLPVAGDAPGSGVLRLTDSKINEAGFVFYNEALPLTAGMQVDFNYYAYNGTLPTGADGLSFFLADGAVDLTSPGAPGGGLGYSTVTNGAAVFDGLAGGYLGLGLDEWGNYSNTIAQGAGCPANPAVGFHPQSVALRGAGNGRTGYCLLATTSVAGFGGVSNALALTRGLPSVERSVRLIVDPPGQGGAQVTADIDFHDGAGYRQVFQAPLPPNPPSTFKFGFASSTGGAVGTHEISQLQMRTVQDLPRLTVAKSHAGAVAAGTTHDFTIQATVAGDPGDGPAQAPITVTDTPPAGDTIAAMPTGSGWDCSATTVGADSASCTYAASAQQPVAAGTALPPITVPIAIAADRHGVAVNTATVASSDNANTAAESTATDSYDVDAPQPEQPAPSPAPTPSPTPAPTAAPSVVVHKTAAPAKLAIAQTADRSKLRAGGTVRYTIKVTNTGKTAARSLKVCDKLPSGLASVSSRPKAAASGRRRCWTVSSLAAGKHRTFTLTARAGKGAFGRKLVSATAGGRGVKTVRATRAVTVTDPLPGVTG